MSRNNTADSEFKVINIVFFTKCNYSEYCIFETLKTSLAASLPQQPREEFLHFFPNQQC